MTQSYHRIIQGGMGVGVSGSKLARAVSRLGQLGVVSGTALDIVLARRLQAGDSGGDVRRALEHFPFPDMARRVLDRYFVPGGKPRGRSFLPVPRHSMQPHRSLTELVVLANFVEVFLAKEGHEGSVGINFLEKIQLPTLPSLFGAMLARVDYVLMGAGIPRTIPGILDDLAAGKAVKLKLDVEESVPGDEFVSEFDPREFCGGDPPALMRPRFLAIISSAALAIALARKATGRVDGFVIEGPSAGGHNAPPRGSVQLTGNGEPVYGARDLPDLEKIKMLGLPFWLAGSYGQPDKLAEALRLGASGVQVGTAFAFCEESGLDPELKRRVIEKCREGTLEVFTDPAASPTGFPFKVVQLEETASDSRVYADRKRICDIGYLQHPYRTPGGAVGYRCPGEPVEGYLQKGGEIADTVGRKCLCNGLIANMGLAQVQADRQEEKPLLTAGDDVRSVARLLKQGRHTYSASDVIRHLLR